MFRSPKVRKGIDNLGKIRSAETNRVLLDRALVVSELTLVKPTIAWSKKPSPVKGSRTIISFLSQNLWDNVMEDKEGNRGHFLLFLFFFFFFFFLLFLYPIFVVKVQEIAWSASYGENKTYNPKQTNNGKFHH